MHKTSDHAAAADPNPTGSNEAGLPPEEEPVIELTPLQIAQDERDAIRDQLIRTMADFQNFRKRTEAEKRTIREMSNEALVLELLPVLDNFERTVQALEQGSSMESVFGGIKAVERQLMSVLQNHNVSRMPSEGEPFDPELHEAIASDPSDEHPEDTVLAEVQAGYKMADKVIRPARVRVSKRP